MSFCRPGKALAPRPGENSTSPAQTSPGRAALTGATGSPPFAVLSPGQGACAAARGNSTAPAQTSPGRAALTGATGSPPFAIL
ncbi:hypothetical protein DN619_04240 [Klebsiella michiganensis]|nr:hypothetical protein DN619_04240 [Klebsiella michiganensis]